MISGSKTITTDAELSRGDLRPHFRVFIGKPMARPRKTRCVAREPGVTFFKPQGIPLKNLEHVLITVDELEAVRLSDYLGLSHEETGQQLKVSRPTVTRMLAKARQAIADALVHGKAIRIEGGYYSLESYNLRCQQCGHRWSIPVDETLSPACPHCSSPSLQTGRESGSE
jgi:predicted DNA-binding protein (UPF0251 family)